MSVIVSFNPPTDGPFTFLANFNNSSYNVSVTWNYGGQRYYVSVNDGQSNLIYSIPLIKSPSGSIINLNLGYFTTQMYFDQLNNQFVIG